MPIYDTGYQRWKGEIQQHPARWWPIVRSGVTRNLARRRFLLLLVVAWVPTLVRGVRVYLDSRTGFVLPGGASDAGYFFKFISPLGYFPAWEQGLWVLVFVVLVGTDLIARDRQYNALQIYFSKPLTQTDYIAGKLGIVATFLLLVSWLPCILLWLFAVAVNTQAGYFAKIWYVPLLATMFCALWVVVAGLLMLLLSAVGRKSVFIAGTWILLYGYGPSHALISLLKAISQNEYLGLLTVSGNLAQVGAWWFGVDRPHEFHPVLSLLVLLALSAGCFWLIRRRSQPVEVVL
jgi:ABC-type transport system involved in multi-copper enzyme maturation permease subunit